jgi:hypothetical protein
VLPQSATATIDPAVADAMMTVCRRRSKGAVMGLALKDICNDAGRAAGELTRRDVARELLAVPSGEAIAGLPGLRREMLAADNPLSAAFWDSAEALLSSIRENAASVGDVRRWLEATGSEPTTPFAGGFLWPDDQERGPVAAEMHALLVAHLEALVANGTINPDKLLAGDNAALTAYEHIQDEWLNTPLPDGREPFWAVMDEQDEELFAASDEADADARQTATELLAGIGPRPCPEDALHAACDRLRVGLQDRDWPFDVLRAAGGVDPIALPEDDRELWLTLAAGAINCREEPPDQYDEADAYAAWFALEHLDWIGAVISLVRAGPGASADADDLAHSAASFASQDEIDDPDDEWAVNLDEVDQAGDEQALSMGFLVVERLWRLLGAIDDESRLTKLGWWGLPESLLRAWQPRADPQE